MAAVKHIAKEGIKRLLTYDEEHAKRVGVPFLAIRRLKDGEKSPFKGGDRQNLIAVDEQGTIHPITKGLLSTVALIDNIDWMYFFEKNGMLDGRRAIGLPSFLSDKAAIKPMVEGIVDQADFASYPNKLIPFIMEKGDVYIKPTNHYGGTLVARLQAGGKGIRLFSHEEPILYATSLLPGWERGDKSEVYCKNGETGELADFFSTIYRPVLRVVSPQSTAMAEETIPAAKFDGRSVDFRFVVLDRGYGFEYRGCFAKVGNGIVSNLSRGGHPAPAPLVIAAFLGKEAPKVVGGLITAMAGLSVEICMKMKETCLQKAIGLGIPQHLINPRLLGVDFALVPKGNALSPVLIEVNAGNLGIDGLKIVDPSLHEKIQMDYARIVRSEYLKAAKE